MKKVAQLLLLACIAFSCKNNPKQTNNLPPSKAPLSKGMLVINPPEDTGHVTWVASAEYERSQIAYHAVPYVKNIYIGKNAGQQAINETLCVVVGHSKKHINARGKDMAWLVDWNEPYLVQHPEIKLLLWKYYNDYIKSGLDTRETRAELIEAVGSSQYQYIHIGAAAGQFREEKYKPVKY